MILVTGATGLVGGHLLFHLLKQEEKIIALKRPLSNVEGLRTIFSFYTNNPADYLKRIEWRTADLLDENELRKVFLDVNVVYHCAAVVSLGNDSSELMDVNVQGTKILVDLALEFKIDKFCFVSSIAACGTSQGSQLIDEKSIWIMNENHSDYAISKHFSELEVWNGMERGLKAVIVNPGVILGISERDSGSSEIFNLVKKGLIFYTNGGTGYIDVRDVVGLMIQLTNSSVHSERFILVGQNCSNKQITDWIAEELGLPKSFVPVGENALFFIAEIGKILFKCFKIQFPINKRVAKTLSTREYYSSEKIKRLTNHSFIPIKQCIIDVCEFEHKKREPFVSL